ncbi:hypothetical protein BJY04DRAFT_219313 [Aspergillus karnatakaensis]|uniref:uncharacterized protein n=1 Tax=Aspergillus karnatakaensis TaxID=1810916 RepID=UPI003CCD3845
MAIPSDITIKTLKGSWTLDKSVTDDTDGILKLQGVSWLIRKGIGAATTTLQFTSETTSPSSSPDTPGTTKITMRQTLTGGIPGSTEERITDWAERERSNAIYGNVLTRSRLIRGVRGDDGILRPDIELQSKTDVKSVEEEVRGFLRGGVPYIPTGETVKEEVEELYVHDFGRNEKGGWTAEQLWALEVIGEQPYLTRRVAVVREDGYELARLLPAPISITVYTEPGCKGLESTINLAKGSLWTEGTMGFVGLSVRLSRPLQRQEQLDISVAEGDVSNWGRGDPRNPCKRLIRSYMAGSSGCHMPGRFTCTNIWMNTGLRSVE